MNMRSARSTSVELPGVVGDALSEAWSSGGHLARDLAAGARDVASEIGSVAAEQLAAGTERVAELVSVARGQRPRRRPFFTRPWFLLVVTAVAFAGTAWWLRSRGGASPAPSHGSASAGPPTPGPNSDTASPTGDTAGVTAGDTAATGGADAGAQDPGI